MYSYCHNHFLHYHLLHLSFIIWESNHREFTHHINSLILITPTPMCSYWTTTNWQVLPHVRAGMTLMLVVRPGEIASGPRPEGGDNEEADSRSTVLDTFLDLIRCVGWCVGECMGGSAVHFLTKYRRRWFCRNKVNNNTQMHSYCTNTYEV